MTIFLLLSNPLFTWLHSCLAIDTVSGYLSIVVNGKILYNETLPSLLGSQKQKPRTLDGKLILGAFDPNILPWQQSRVRVTNVQVYSSLLNLEELKLLTTNQICQREGDILSWRDMSWTFHGMVVAGEVMLKEFCQPKMELRYVMSVPFDSWTDCMEICPKIKRGRVPALDSQKKKESFIEFYNHVASEYFDTLPVTWLPYRYSPDQNALVDYTTNVAITYTNFNPRCMPDEYTTDNCVSFAFPLGGWCFPPCILPEGYFKTSCTCQNEEQAVLIMRGLCEKTLLDKYYVIANEEQTGQLVLEGIKGTTLSFDKNGFSWRAAVIGQKVSGAAIKSHTSFLLGSSSWTFYNDSPACSQGEDVYNQLLKLSGCEVGEFTCGDGQCVTMEQRCNQLVDCRDESDEQNCKLLVLKESYNKKVAPISAINQTIMPVKVVISIDLLKIVNIRESDHKIALKFGIMLEWTEPRAVFYNLKKKTSLNALKEDEIGVLWLPFVIYENTDMMERVRLQDGDGEVMTTITVFREGNFTRSGDSVVDEIEIFQGTENRLTMNQTYTKNFHCEYLLHRYPFDVQKCSIDIKVQSLDIENILLIPGNIEMNEKTVLTMFVVSKWSIVYRNESNPDRGIEMLIVFKRRIMNELLTTYLPSILLVLITYATTFFKPFYFEAAVTVNLTTMLVLTTLFISVMNQLPSTAYVKMIDVWLISGQLIPFIEVVLLTIMEALREGNAGVLPINHHGKERIIEVGRAESRTVDLQKTSPTKVLKISQVMFIYLFYLIANTKYAGKIS